MTFITYRQMNCSFSNETTYAMRSLLSAFGLTIGEDNLDGIRFEGTMDNLIACRVLCQCVLDWKEPVPYLLDLVPGDDVDYNGSYIMDLLDHLELYLLKNKQT